MRILDSTEKEREGNDCWIFESVSLFETQGLYVVLTTQHVVGWSPYEKSQTFTTRDYYEAIAMYKEHGGKINN